jgi:hypothetical protein
MLTANSSFEADAQGRSFDSLRSFRRSPVISD